MEASDKMFDSTIFFEGAEKLIELWFGSTSDNNEVLDEFDDYHNLSSIIRISEDEEDEKMSNDSGEDESIYFASKYVKSTSDELVCQGKRDDLRRIPREALEQLLQVVKCEIISSRKNDQIDSYVLSESSMFISKNRFILKTCGNTVLLKCLKPLLYLVREYTSFDKIIDVFYSHKNFMHPELQDKIHTRFDYEVQILDNFFQNGAAYCFGRLGKDCWYFYTLYPENPSTRLQINEPDQTLEIIMQNLDEQKMQIFKKDFCSTAKEATTKSGIDKIFNDAIIDDYLFDPCGYSMNGIIKGQYYFTIHITPEPQCSYVSFETNYPMTNYLTLVAKVLRLFNPNKFTVTLFANENSIAGENIQKLNKHSFATYKAKDLQYCRVKNYDLTCGHFSKTSC